ncbi:MAG: site-specific DNA-methyltransferase [Clostridia bacterium]|nr:site-specific DNA-methyltransferase [Clostridia bacterium]
MKIYQTDNINLFNGDSLNMYDKWETPTVIISDGPYGVSGFKGDLISYKNLGNWYEPHIAAWTQKSTPQTTLWFWNTEIGWATVHPILEKYGWEYKCCNVWDKGKSHIAGATNTKTLSKLPISTEVCVQYVLSPKFTVNNSILSMQEWLIYEWKRTGLPFSKTNEACGVVNAATRKYFTKCHLWYKPPVDAFEKIVQYANDHGKKDGYPYFSTNGKSPLTRDEWNQLSPKFYCKFGLTNVWTLPQLSGSERIKNGSKAVHFNQKPLALIEQIIEMSSDPEDVIWDPFAGLATTAIACKQLNRKCYSAEIDEETYKQALKRILPL